MHGPYSADLEEYLYENSECLQKEDLSAYRLTEDAAKGIDTVKAMAANAPASLTLPRWHELLASLWFMHTRWNESVETLCAKLRKYQPSFTREQCEQA